MIMQTVFDADGKAYSLEPVDAREYVASGSYFRKKPAADDGVTPAAPPPPAAAEPEKVRAKPGPKPKLKD